MELTIVGSIIFIILGILATDFIAATQHWIEDNYLSYDSKWFQDTARANTLHHYHPRAITCKTNTEIYNAKLPRIVICILLFWYAFVYRYYRICFFLIGFILTSALPEINHKYTHMRDCERPYFVSLLQNSGLLVSRKQHVVHHSSEYSEGNYGMLLGFTNFFYDRVFHIWTLLEMTIQPCCKKTNKFPEQPICKEACPRPVTKEEYNRSARKLYKLYVTKGTSFCKKQDDDYD